MVTGGSHPSLSFLRMQLLREESPSFRLEIGENGLKVEGRLFRQFLAGGRCRLRHFAASSERSAYKQYANRSYTLPMYCGPALAEDDSFVTEICYNFQPSTQRCHVRLQST